MTVHTLNTPLQLPRPDTEVVKSSRHDLRLQTESLAGIYLPAFREELLALQQEFATVEGHALNALTLIPGALSNDGLPDLLTSIEALRAKPHSPELAEAITELGKDLNALLESRVSKVQGYVKALDDGLVNLKAASLSDVRAQVDSLEEESAERTALITELQAQLEAPLAQQTLLNTLIGDIEAMGPLDKFKPLVGSLQTLVDIDPKNPLVGSVKAGLEGIKNILDLASDAIKYEHLINKRSELQERLDGQRSRVNDLSMLQDEGALRLSQLQAFQNVDQPKNLYLMEVGKLLESLRRFLTSSAGPADEDITLKASRFLNLSKVLSSYLDELQRDWRT